MIPTGFESRPVAAGDAAEVAELLNAPEEAHCTVVTGRLDEQDMLDWLGGFDLETETIGLRTSSGELAAAGFLEHRDDVLDLAGIVQPAWTGRGLGTALLVWAEDTVRRRPG